MKYALLIYAAEKEWADKSKDEQGRIYYRVHELHCGSQEVR